MMSLRKCSRCGRHLSLSEFYRDQTKSSGRSSHCKECSDKARQKRGARGDRPVPKKSFWRRFEAATLQKRLSMVTWRWVAGVQVGEEYYEGGGEPDLSLEEITRALLKSEVPWEEEEGPEDLLAAITWHRVIVHDETWIKLRTSFYDSREWREFRQVWLAEHPACTRCGRTDGILVVHHTDDYTVDSTVIDEGFLEGLRHPERFETLCNDCHQEMHIDLRIAESLSKWLKGGRGR